MTNPTPKISILVPIYNVEKYLRQCLESLVNQTLQDIEIICLNDGSTDSSPEIIKEFHQRDPRIRVINKPNSGYGDSMNQGLEHATGEYIGIVESDDYIDLDAFEKLYQIAHREQADVVKTNYYRTSTAEGLHEELVSEIKTFAIVHPAESRFVFEFSPAIWSAIYRREFLKQNHIEFLPTPGASYQDLSFSFKVWALAQKVILVPDAFLHYRIDNETSSINNPGKVNCVVDEYAEIERFLRERDLLSGFASTMIGAKFRNYHWNFQRLNSILARDFYQTWVKAMSQAQQNGWLNADAFRRQDWLALQAMLRSPKLAYFILKARLKLCH